MLASSPPSVTTAANLSTCDALRTSMSSVWACDMSLGGEAPIEKTIMTEQHLHARQCCILPSRVDVLENARGWEKGAASRRPMHLDIHDHTGYEGRHNLRFTDIKQQLGVKSSDHQKFS